MQTPISFSITGTGAVVSIGLGQSRWVQLATPSTNSSPVLVGSSEVSSTVGFPVPGGAGMFYPPTVDLFSFYELSEIKAYIADGDVLNGLIGG